MPFCDAIELFDYWKEYPPMHVLLRGFVDYRPPTKELTDGADIVRALAPVTKGTATKVARAPKHIQAIIEGMKRAKNG